MSPATSPPPRFPRSRRPSTDISARANSPRLIWTPSSRRRVSASPAQKKTLDLAPALAREAEVAELIRRFLTASKPDVATLERTLRAAVFQQSNQVLEWVLQQAVDGLDMAYQPRPDEVWKGRMKRQVDGLFGSFTITRDYYHNPATKTGHCPADAALGLEAGYTPGLARIICLMGSEQASYQAAETSLQEVGGVRVSARQIQRMVQAIGPEATAWQKRPAKPESTTAKVLYVSADGTGVPVCKAELEGVAGRQADGSAKTRQAYLGCVFTQH